MHHQRRLPKRSILGTRVSAPWSDGRFYCGTIESMSEQPNGQYMYNVLFDDGYSKLYFHKDIVGSGFNNTVSAYLKHGQRVFVTYNGREVSGRVVKHNKATNEVLLEVECSNGELVETVKKLEEIRLMESRRSLRLNSDSDFSRGKITQGIDVPRSRHNRRRRREGNLEQRESSDDHDTDDIDMDSDMQLAAVALQKLSCSPASPKFPPVDLSKSPVSWSDRNRYRPSPSPPMQKYSLSAPQGFFGSVSTDEGIEVEDILYQMDEDISPKRYKPSEEVKPPSRLRYKCTWKGCHVIEDNCDIIEKHIRDAHIGRREDNLSDHEEEFYYEEFEQSELDEMTSNMEVMTCASPTQSCPLNLTLPRQPLGQDHDYNRKDAVQTQQVPAGSTSTPILIPGAIAIPVHPQQTPPSAPTAGYMFPQNSPYSRQTFKLSPLSPTTASPKHTTVGRKSRSDIKKCRKVYGMENRDMWCTQCKWKKACTRFVPENTPQ